MGNAFGLNPGSYVIRILLLFLILAVSAAVCISIGTTSISIHEILAVFTGNPQNELTKQIIIDIRLPRILLAIAVGGGLSAAGAVFQAILKNPLAEPYILGISSGGAFGAVLSFMLGVSFVGTQVFSFAGSLAVIFLVFMLGRRFGGIEPNILLLSGVMVGAFFSAFILLMMSFADSSFRTAIFWLIGNLSLADKDVVGYILASSFLVSVILSFDGYKFNLITMGDESASNLGLNVNRFKIKSYVLASLLVGVVVSVSGIIGFVGLLVPHICRMIFGADNRIVIPAAFMLGGAFLILSDTIARSIIPPSELPVGAITAILGAPVFIYLLRKQFKKEYF